MRLGVVLEGVFNESPDGRRWTSPPLGNELWARYLSVFDEVLIIARVRNLSEVSNQTELLDRPGLTLRPVPYYKGPRQYFASLRRAHASVRESVHACDAVVARVPSVLCLLALPHILAAKPLGLEVVGDPDDIITRASTGSLLSPAYRWILGRSLSWMCRRACCVSYVTESTLQKKYRPGPGTVTSHYSSVELNREDLAEHSRAKFGREPVRLVTVGSLDQLYKGPDILLRALASVRDPSSFELTWVGGGEHLESMRVLAGELGLAGAVRFVGPAYDRPSIRRFLDEADIFVLPSRQEGLPRAMIEAMARGLPCIGTRVGGVPELLSDDVLVSPDDPEALADKIIELAASPGRLVRLSQRNLQEARWYLREHLEPRRRKFYEALRQVAESRLILSNRDT